MRKIYSLAKFASLVYFCNFTNFSMLFRGIYYFCQDKKSIVGIVYLPLFFSICIWPVGFAVKAVTDRRFSSGHISRQKSNNFYQKHWRYFLNHNILLPYQRQLRNFCIGNNISNTFCFSASNNFPKNTDLNHEFSNFLKTVLSHQVDSKGPEIFEPCCMCTFVIVLYINRICELATLRGLFPPQRILIVPRTSPGAKPGQGAWQK
jgi:hypothetical protein